MKKLILYFAYVLSFLLVIECNTAWGGLSNQEESVNDALSKGELESALVILKDSKDEPKNEYLLRQLNRAITIKFGGKKTAHAHKNAGIAYHNLYLYLKTQGIGQEQFLKEARKRYRKAAFGGTLLEKSKCELLDASLYAAEDNTDQAMKKFSKLNTTLLSGDFEAMEYLAVFYASMGRADDTVDALDGAFKIEPQKTYEWLVISDDFEKVKDNPAFRKAFKKWESTVDRANLTVSLPPPEKPRLDISDDTGIFHPKKDMPKLKLKKHGKKSGKKKAVKAKKAAKP